MTSPNLEHTRTWVRDVVRSGLLGPDELVAELTAVVAADHPDLPAAETAAAWIAEADAAWRRDAREWGAGETSYDRLQQAFAALEERGLLVLQGVPDHWSAKHAVETTECRGVAWFTAADVWHAIDEPMLEVNVWHPDTANAAPGQPLLDEVIGVLAAAGLDAHFDEGRIEVAARWQRRP